jgi:hypothetical protein
MGYLQDLPGPFSGQHQHRMNANVVQRNIVYSYRQS